MSAKGDPGMVRTGHFAGWPVTSGRVRSLTRLPAFVRLSQRDANEGRCPR